MSNEILVASATFQATVDGRETVVVAGKTTVRAGHPLLDAFGGSFVPLVPTFEVESAPAPDPAPPVPPVTPAAKKAADKSGTR